MAQLSVSHFLFDLVFVPDDVDFWLSFVPICQLFSFANKIEEEIFKKLV